MERLVVIGAGAVGGSIGGLLSRTGLAVTFIARGEHAAVMRERGLHLRTPAESLRLEIPVALSVEEIDWKPGDVALVATKLGDARAVFDELALHAGSQLPVVCAFNGIHGERWASDRFSTVLSMLIWLPATHLQPGVVLLHSQGSLGVLDVGPTCGDSQLELCERMGTHLRQAGFDSVSRTDIAEWKVAKLISNLGNTAQALVQDDWLSVCEAARQEGTAILEAAGVLCTARDVLLERVAKVKLGTIDGADREGGSTWQSRARGKPLESPWLEGVIVELAAQLGISAPINQRIVEAAREARDYSVAELLG
ncbi:MAG: 2-dehydropantoate 2-reductase [Planctomycetota bacterium]|jgi:2-dehydropantoate 2-reductase